MINRLAYKLKIDKANLDKVQSDIFLKTLQLLLQQELINYDPLLVEIEKEEKFIACYLYNPTSMIRSDGHVMYLNHTAEKKENQFLYTNERFLKNIVEWFDEIILMEHTNRSIREFDKQFKINIFTDDV